MNEMVDKIAASTGLAPDVAEKAIGMMLGFLQREADAGAVARMIESVPHGPEMAAQFNGAEEPKSLVGKMFGAFGGTGDVMAFAQQLVAAGVPMGEIPKLAKQVIAVAREHAGDEVVDEVLDSVPALKAFI